jgi:uncharacterized protein (DUF2252 family)
MGIIIRIFDNTKWGEIVAFKPYELEPALGNIARYKSLITESVEKRLEEGKALRESVARESHGEWEQPSNRRDAIDILNESNEGRVTELIPIRYGRMMVSPFTFLRGSASVMAFDLSRTPITGLTVQACGDCHLSNFGLFATPERNLVFDVNDFDETIPGPWEWDLKRLVASIYVAYTQSGMTDKEAYSLAVSCARMYRKAMRRASGMNTLDLWYMQLDMGVLQQESTDQEVTRRLQRGEEIAQKRVHEYVLPKVTAFKDGQSRIVDEPPLVMHYDDPQIVEGLNEIMERYKDSLSHSKRVLVDRYKTEDLAMKVVGVGSVGTRCSIVLLLAKESDPLLLQIKEARSSVLEPYVKMSEFKNNGQRVVVGQQIMQSASDMFLGWTQFRSRDFYVRQLKDMKVSAVIEAQPFVMAKFYVRACALVLAKAHARSGDPALIAGYLGKSSVFDYAMADFARSYAKQTRDDHEAMLEAIKSGRIEATTEE